MAAPSFEEKLNSFGKSLEDTGKHVNAGKAVSNVLNVKPEAFANEVLTIMNNFSIPNLTHLKLQKLLYYCYAIITIKLGKVLFLPNDKDGAKNINFLQLGPVITPVYYNFRHFGNKHLLEHFVNYKQILLKENISEDYHSTLKILNLEELDDELMAEIRNSIVYTIAKIGKKNLEELTDVSRRLKSAWHTFYELKKCNADNGIIIQKILEEVKGLKYFNKVTK
ncbi:MAG: hypothetical protein JJW01_00830 [Alphaproteobacteria bacterium]|nr:hypothetical protein [Rickettsiales bacterium]